MNPPSTAVCPLCDNTGWKTIHDANQNSRVTRCDCMLQARSERLLDRARIPARYEHCDLSNFDTHVEAGDKSLSRALVAAQRFVDDYPVESTGLLLIGPVGVGKTHVAVGIIKELIRSKGIGCLFYDYRELLKEIRNSYNPSVNTTEMEVLRPVLQTEVLVVDELGAERPTDWVWDTVSHLLNTRYNERRTTIITSNYRDLPPGGTEAEPARSQRAHREETLGDRITERMRSRLHEMCRKVELNGRDFRQTFRSASFNHD
jgi:DNA replication protein DnaC